LPSWGIPTLRAGGERGAINRSSAGLTPFCIREMAAHQHFMRRALRHPHY
jgi:hypothetical protein